MRVKRGVPAKKRKKNLLARTKGYKYGRKNLYRRAHEASMKAGAHAYRDRRLKKRNFRKLWTIRINAAARQHGMSYSQFMGALRKADIGLNRKMLQQIAIEQPEMFAAIVGKVGGAETSMPAEKKETAKK